MTAFRVLLFAGFATALMYAQTPGITTPAGTNVLLGRVVEMGTDAPVGGAIVTITGHFDASGKPANPDPSARGADLSTSLHAMTTADGYFVFRNLPAGRFTVATRAFGYLNNDYPPALIEIRDKQKSTDVRLQVWKYAAMGGRVVDERGEPITGIPVTALQRLASGGGVLMRRVATGLTDDRGVYRLAQLEPGDYTVAVLSTPTTLPASVANALDPSAANRSAYTAVLPELQQSGFLRSYGSRQEGQQVGALVLQRPGPVLPPAPDGRPLGFANTYYPGTPRPHDATVVTLGSGESRTDLDLAVRLTPTVGVTGVLTGPDGPMIHVALTLAPPGADLDNLDPVGVATAITDERGTFAFLAITPGEYALSSLAALDMSQTMGEGRPLWASRSLNVGDTGITGLTIAMQPGVKISGRVEFRSTSGVVANPPSQRQVINLQPVHAEAWRTGAGVVQPDGTFRTGGDPPGRYLINASSPPGWHRQMTLLAGRPVLDDIIELDSTELSGLVVMFGQTTNRVSGLVSDRADAPDPDAAVIVFPADSNAWREGIFTNSRRTRAVRATSAGFYDMATLVPGEYYVAAASSRFTLTWADPTFLERLIPGATRVTLGPTDEKTVPLRTITLPPR